MKMLENGEQIERWGMYELLLSGPSEGNPYQTVSLKASFQREERIIEVDGFYDDNGKYRIRFMPDTEGEWTYSTSSRTAELNGITGSFMCVKPSSNNHGPVRIKDDAHFTYEDGTAYIPVGTTSYGWIHQDEQLQLQTLQTLSNSPFNKIRMCVIMNDYGDMEPADFPFVGSRAAGFDLTRFNSKFFANLDARIQDLLDLGIEADLIIFHPYDKGRWGFDQMDAATDDFYLRYVIARLGAYRNIWWSLANEYDFMEHKTMADWDRLFRIVQNEDPYNHLRSLHNGTKMYDHASVVMYDHSKPWVTHCSIQHWDVTMAGLWHQQYKKPVLIDECCYEGNMERRWGNLTGEEMTRRFWDGIVRGAFVSHAETYLDTSEHLWLAKGGGLYGESPDRIAYLRKIIEAAPEGYRRIPEIRDVPTIGIEGQYYLQYFGIHQPLYRMMDLPEGKEFKAEIIDTWNMKTLSVQENLSGTCRIELPGRLYIAIRITRVGANV